VEISATNRELRRIKPQDLSPNQHNARTHDAGQIAEIQKSIRRFGVLRPIICDENLTVLAGHGLLDACLAEGLEEVPALVIPGLTDDEKRAYMLADNRLAERSAWDWDLLTEELAELSPEVSLADIGFGEWDISAVNRSGSNGSEGDDEQTQKCPRCGHEFDVDSGPASTT
jgi:ParB-like chromosome segregation protein Spo0J